MTYCDRCGDDSYGRQYCRKCTEDMRIERINANETIHNMELTFWMERIDPKSVQMMFRE